MTLDFNTASITIFLNGFLFHLHFTVLSSLLFSPFRIWHQRYSLDPRRSPIASFETRETSNEPTKCSDLVLTVGVRMCLTTQAYIRTLQYCVLWNTRQSPRAGSHGLPRSQRRKSCTGYRMQDTGCRIQETRWRT